MSASGCCRICSADGLGLSVQGQVHSTEGIPIYFLLFYYFYYFFKVLEQGSGEAVAKNLHPGDFECLTGQDPEKPDLTFNVSLSVRGGVTQTPTGLKIKPHSPSAIL